MPTNPRDSSRMMDVLDSTSKHAKTVHYLYVGFILYTIITVSSTSDRQLLLKGDRVDLPILNVSLPLDTFYTYAPIAIIVLFCYLMIYIYRLNVLVFEWEQYCESNNIPCNKSDLYPWMINIVRESDKGFIGLLQKLFVILMVWFSLPIPLFIIAGKFLKSHSDTWSFFLIGIAFFSIFIAFWFWNKIQEENYSDICIYGFPPTILLLIVYGYFFVTDINKGNLEPFNLNLRNQILINIPKNEWDSQQKYWVDLENENLNGANLINAVLRKANLNETQLNKADIGNADLSDSDLVRAELNDANLTGTRLENARMNEADLNNSNIVFTKFNKANLNGTKWENAYIENSEFVNARMNRAHLKNAHIVFLTFQKVDLSYANFENAFFENVVFQGAKQTKEVEKIKKAEETEGANLRHAIFENSRAFQVSFREVELNHANLQNIFWGASSFDGANLTDANLKGAIFAGEFSSIFHLILHCEELPDIANIDEMDIFGTNFQGATLTRTNLRDAILIGSRFDEAELSDADFTNANFARADLENANGLSVKQICSASTLYKTKLDKDLLTQITNQDNGCPEKLTKASFDDWYELRCERNNNEQ